MHHRVAQAARMVPNFAQPIILAYGTCELSKNFPPFGRRVAVTHIAQNQSRLIALTPYKIGSLHAALGFAG